MSEKITLKINPELKNLTPIMTKEDYEALKLSIRENGYDKNKPIECMEDGTILDGHMRFKACNELKLERVEVEPTYKILDNIKTMEDARTYVWICGLRRNLNVFQKAQMGYKLYTYTVPIGTLRHLTTQEIAERVGVGRTTLLRCCNVLDNTQNGPYLKLPRNYIERLESGKMSIGKAHSDLKILSELVQAMLELPESEKQYFENIKEHYQKDYEKNEFDTRWIKSETKYILKIMKKYDQNAVTMKDLMKLISMIKTMEMRYPHSVEIKDESVLGEPYIGRNGKMRQDVIGIHARAYINYGEELEEKEEKQKEEKQPTYNLTDCLRYVDGLLLSDRFDVSSLTSEQRIYLEEIKKRLNELLKEETEQLIDRNC